MALPLANQIGDLLLDSNNDLVITDDLQWTRGIDAIAQDCRIAIQMFANEWFANLDVGVPYFEQILGQKPNVAIPIMRTTLRKMLLKVDGVLDVPQLDIVYVGDTRGVNVTFTVSTALGDTPPTTLPFEGP